jgi:proteic killer suppression protein
VIQDFQCKETEKVWRGNISRRFPANIQRIALRKLTQISAAESVNDLRVPPGNRLELLKGVRAGQHSIRINDQWRICFIWKNIHAYKVEIIDYH